MSFFAYYERINKFSRTYLVKGNEHLIKNPSMFSYYYENIINEIGELLLYHDGIAIEVYGENIPLAILVNTFGVTGVESLLEQKAIEFVLNTSMITYLKSDIKGVMPLQSGMHTSKAHCDPEKSATLGLEWMTNLLPRPTRRNLIRKVTKAYKVPPTNIAKEAVKFGHEGYNLNLFKELGLPKEKDILSLNENERSKLCDFATQSLKLALLSKFQYNTVDTLDITKINQNEFYRLQNMNIIEENIDELFKLERLPNFKELINKEIIKLKDIPNLRNTKNSKKFREWILNSSCGEESEHITKQYLDSIEDTKGIFQKNPIKLFKTLIVLASTGALGVALPGATGVLASSGVSLLDTYIIDAISKGWNPRHYFTQDITNLLKKKNNNNNRIK